VDGGSSALDRGCSSQPAGALRGLP